MADVVVFGTRDPTGGKEEGVELHAQGLPSHVLHRQLTAETQENSLNIYSGATVGNVQLNRDQLTC